MKAERIKNYDLQVGNLETKRAIMDQRNLVRAMMLLVAKGKAGEVYNLSSERVYQVRNLKEK